MAVKLSSSLLKKLGFGRIAIADDSQENINAARRLEKRFRGISFEYYQRGDSLAAQIPHRYQEIDLILTDREMETKDAGLDVIETAWKYQVPAFVCSGGYHHAGQPRLRIAPALKGFTLPDGLLKDNPEAWYRILEGIANDATEESTSLLAYVLRARKCSVPVPIEFFGEEARKVVKECLDLL
jgi:CheY-like chemotaxis protein